MSANDRIQEQAAQAKLPKPEVKIIVNGQSVYKPGMKTYFAGAEGEDTAMHPDGGIRGSEGRVVGGQVCVCNAVCTCDSQTSTCPCNSQCSCEGYTTCTCDSQCSCQSYSSGGCSCNQVCTCVPVH